jgi:hypothetical protein
MSKSIRENVIHRCRATALLLLGFLLGLLAAGTAQAAATPNDPAAVARLQALSRDLAQQAAAGRTPLYLSLRDATQGPQGLLNSLRDVQLMRVDERGFPRFYLVQNLVAAQSISTDLVWPGGGAGLALTGANTAGELGVWDGGGVRLTHQEFGGRVTQIDAPSATHYHSTHVAGTLIAAGVDAGAKGMSYAGQLHAYDWDNDDGEMASAAAGGLLVSNHSYGSGTGWYYNGTYYWFGDVTVSTTEDNAFGFYTNSARDWDQIAHNAPWYLIVKSAGNDRNDTGPVSGSHYYWDPFAGAWTSSTAVRDNDGGATGYDTIGWKGNAKNILTVGAVNDIPGGWTAPGDVVMSTFSNWGPTDDGRIKPDLVANGIGLYSATDTGDADYVSLNGTSMSGPNAAGSLNLLTQYYQSLHGGASMRSATLKALALHTCDEAGPSPGPDYSFGWGMMNTRSAADLITASTGTDLPIRELDLAHGETDVIELSSDGTAPIVATIVWTDPPGTPPAWSLDPPNLMLVNDLDLRVERVSDGLDYEPWILNPASPASAATTGDNFRDNVEMVRVAAPAAGAYRLVVSHKGSLGSPQDYSLVFTGLTTAAAPEPPVVTNVAFAQRTDGSGLVDVTYDLADPDSPTLTVTMEVSADGGLNWTVPVVTFSGDVGAGVTPGAAKAIVWDAATDAGAMFSDQVQVRITADDGS